MVKGCGAVAQRVGNIWGFATVAAGVRGGEDRNQPGSAGRGRSEWTCPLLTSQSAKAASWLVC